MEPLQAIQNGKIRNRDKANYYSDDLVQFRKSCDSFLGIKQQAVEWKLGSYKLRVFRCVIVVPASGKSYKENFTINTNEQYVQELSEMVADPERNEFNSK